MIFNNSNTQISPSATIGKNVRIGDNTIILDRVIIEDHVTIGHNCVIGEPLNDYYSNPDYENPVTRIGAHSLIRSHAIIYAGNTLGEYVTTGHRIILRENNLIGHHTVLGTQADIQGHVKIGSYCRLYTSVVISQLSEIGNYVFLYPFVVLTNDPYPPSNDLKGPSISDFSVIAAHATIFSGVTVGANCLVGAGSVVKQDIADYTLAAGDPAKKVTDIRKYVVMGKGKVYPWMKRFSRDMPWGKAGWENWDPDRSA